MKSTELAQLFIDAADKDTARHNIVLSLFADYSELVEKRNAQSICAQQSILKEINDKWNAVDRKIGGELIKDGFYFVIGRLEPKLLPYLPDSTRSEANQ